MGTLEALGVALRSVVVAGVHLAEQLGAPGLAVLAYVESSFVSIPEAVDLLLFRLVTDDPAHVVWYAGVCAAASTAGCGTLYVIGLKGEHLVHRWVHASKLDDGLRLFKRYGLLTVFVPSLIPTPFPMKVFLLLSGVSGIGAVRFFVVMGLGRVLRYGAEAWLALRYGLETMDFVDAHAGTVTAAVLGALVVALAAWVVWRRRAVVARPIAYTDRR